MITLSVRPEPVLIHQRYGVETAAVGKASDVTHRAVQYLFEPVALDPAFTLGDLFELLQINEDLRQVFRRDYAEELCAEARKGPLPQSVEPGMEDVSGIEYLELYRQWRLDTLDATYWGVHGLDLHGVGFPVAEDAPDYGVKAGERIRWSISLTPLRELLSLPLRIRKDFDIVEDDIDACAYSQPVGRGQSSEVLLGQLIHSTLWELSFHGTPQEQADVFQSLKEQLTEIDAGVAETIPHDEVFAHLDEAGFSAMFEPLGDTLKNEVRAALRDIPDNQAVGPYFDHAFNNLVRVKPAFRGLSAREFRRMFRMAGHDE